MAKTLDAIRRSRKTEGTTAVPTGYARAPTYKNPPGAVPLKILHAMIDHAGTDIQDDAVWHEMPLREAIRTTSIHHISAEQADEYLDELEALRLSFWRYDVKSRNTVIERGVVVQHAMIHLPDNKRDQATIRLRFGSIFCQLARTSDFYTLLQNKVIWALRSRYAIALYQHIAALSGQRHPKAVYLVEEVREILGVPEGKLRSYKDLHARAIKPAVEQVNSCPTVRWTVAYRAVRRGRGVQRIVFEWAPRDPSAQALLPLSLDDQAEPEHAPGRNTGTVTAGDTNETQELRTPAEAFPAKGSIVGTAWAAIVSEHANGYDADWVANDYRRWCANAGIPLDKRGGVKRFTTFCAGYAQNQSKPRAKAGAGKEAEPGLWRHSDDPLGSFPWHGRIRGTDFERLAAEHAPGVEPDAIGKQFAERLKNIGLPFNPAAGITHEEDFVKFCQQAPDPGNERPN